MFEMLFIVGQRTDAKDEDEDEKQEERPISRQVSMKMAKCLGRFMFGVVLQEQSE